MNKKLMENNLSRWLKENRKKSGLTLIQLKRDIHDLCTDGYLSRLENGRHKNKKGHPPKPDIEIIDALAIALKRPINEARAAAGYAPEDSEKSTPPQILEINWNEFSDRQIQQIISYVNFVKSENETLILQTDSAEQTKEEIERDYKLKQAEVRQFSGEMLAPKSKTKMKHPTKADIELEEKKAAA